MDVLIHISQQLSNSTTPAYSPAEFAVSPSIATVNVLFFLSLALVLIDAFLAMLVKGWLREFDHSWRKHTVADLRAQERERRLQALEHWKLAELVTLLPILIQMSLLFFCIGLIVLLFPIHLISAIFSSVALVAGLTFYLFTTYVSIIDPYSPFPSPVSHGLINLAHFIACFVKSGIPFRTPHPSLPQKHQQGTMGAEKPATITHSHSQIDPQTYLDIFERLVTGTAKGVENIPVFLDLLDQPVKDLRLQPSNVAKWRELLHTTLGLLGDLSTFSDSAACTIARSVLFCYDGGSADQQLARNLIHHFDHMCSGQTNKHKLNSLFSPYLYYYCHFGGDIDWYEPMTLCNTIAFLEPSNAADLELLWMVNTLQNSYFLGHPSRIGDHQLPGIFTALLTYVSRTEQSRRSHVPLTAAIIHAMYFIMSSSPVHGLDWHYFLPGTVVATSKSFCFHQVDTLDIWHDDSVQLVSTLFQQTVLWFWQNENDLLKFHLALIAALYIDCTKQAVQAAAAAFENLLTVPTFPVIEMTTWWFANAYDQTKLAGYWYMAVFQKPIYGRSGKSPVQDIRDIIQQTIHNCSKMTLSALHLLDFSMKYHCEKSPASSLLLTRDEDGTLEVEIIGTYVHIGTQLNGPFDPWFLLHLDSLFSPGSILHKRDLEQLQWNDTLEQVHIATARLTLYGLLQGEEDKDTKSLKPEPELLKLFLQSKDYAVCTGAFRYCLNLASQLSSARGIHDPGTMGCQWIEHLVRVLLGPPYKRIRSWEFLTEHLAPKWATLPLSWCQDFASAFLFLNVHTPYWGEFPPYQLFAKSLRFEQRPNQTFLPFLGTMLQLIKDRVTWDQLYSFDTWLAKLPEHIENQDAHIKLDNILATRKQEIIGKTRLPFLQNFQCHIHYDQ